MLEFDYDSKDVVMRDPMDKLTLEKFCKEYAPPMFKSEWGKTYESATLEEKVEMLKQQLEETRAQVEQFNLLVGLIKSAFRDLE